jgi:hypothetical protein
MTRFSLYAIVLLSFALLLAPRISQAAEDYDNCTGTIGSLPAVINTSGTWCVKQDLSTAVTSGSVILVQADNVTIDCNDFKLDGSGAGAGTTARGVFSANVTHLTIRHCVIVGFSSGVQINGTNLRVEDNRFDGNKCFGVYVDGDGSIVQRNRVFNMGGSTNVCDPIGISGIFSVDIVDNTVAGVTATSGSNRYAFGIGSQSEPGGSIVGNRVSGIVKDGTARAFAIESDNREIIRDNDLVGDGSAGSNGVYCALTTGRARDNVISGFETPVSGCTLSVGNVIKP